MIAKFALRDSELDFVDRSSQALGSSNGIDRDVWLGRADEVKAAFTHAYDDYKLLAYPHDELRPLTNETRDQ